MRTSHRLLFRLFIAMILAALVVPPAAQASTATPGSPDHPPADALRHSVSQSDLQTQFEQTAAWLDNWQATRPTRPPVDPAQQSQKVAEWTVIVHVAADNNLEVAGLSDVNEMEAVGSSPDVNIIAQLDRSAEYSTADGDWIGARRYYIQQDNDPRAITSPVMQDLGVIDSGDPNSIADLAIWAITNYPAQKYMLVMWDHGGAWTSHSADEDTGSDIDLPETVSALERIKAETGVGQFEVIGFDMCIMSQLEVWQAVTPYARYGIGSEENEPGAGWFYTFLDEIVKNPAMDGRQLSPIVVDYFMYFLGEVLGDQDVYTLAAVDLSQGANLINALDQFSTTFQANPQAGLSPISDARNNTIQYGGFSDPQVQDYWSSVDLYRFMELLTQISTSTDLTNAAQGVMQAVKSFVIYEQHVDALAGTNGTSIFFPTTYKAYKQGVHNERYPREVPTTMADWIQFLDAYHGTATSTVTSAPGVSIRGVYPDTASIYNPAVVSLEVSGRDILRVNYAVSYIKSQDERIVLDFDYLVSRTTTATGANIVDWSDGVTARTFTWEAEVPMLTDGTTSTYALLIPNPDNPGMALVNGTYIPAGGGSPVDAQLLFDLNTRQSTTLWGINQTASGNMQPFELQVQPGDTFQPLWLTMDANNTLSGTSNGDTLTLNDATSISFDKVPAPSGQYSISFVAENVSGANNLSEAMIQVNNDGLDATLRGYTDLTYGVNFLYPSTWIRPRFTPDGTRLFTADLTTNTLLSLYPYTGVSSAEETDAAIRASWNDLQDLTIVQQQSVEINGLPSYVTDYTYTYNGEGRVGAVIAIFVPSQSVGYAFDLDAPASNPGPAQEALQALVKSIHFFDTGTELGQSAWQTVSAANGLVQFSIPATWTPDSSGSWTLYGPVGDTSVFAAIAVAATSGQTNEQLAQYWQGQLQNGVQDFQVSASEPFYIGGREWHVVVFTYQGAVKTAGALFTTTNVGGQDYTFWIEAPDSGFDQLYSDVFSVIIGGFTFNG